MNDRKNIEALPQDMLNEIFKYLSPTNLINLREESKILKQYIDVYLQKQVVIDEIIATLPANECLSFIRFCEKAYAQDITQKIKNTLENDPDKTIAILSKLSAKNGYLFIQKYKNLSQNKIQQFFRQKRDEEKQLEEQYQQNLKLNQQDKQAYEKQLEIYNDEKQQREKIIKEYMKESENNKKEGKALPQKPNFPPLIEPIPPKEVEKPSLSDVTIDDKIFKNLLCYLLTTDDVYSVKYLMGKYNDRYDDIFLQVLSQHLTSLHNDDLKNNIKFIATYIKRPKPVKRSSTDEEAPMDFHTVLID